MKTKTVTVNFVVASSKWSVKSDTATRAYRICDTQREAIQVGRQLAINKQCELIVVRVDGSIRSKDTFKGDLTSRFGMFKGLD